jgi:hypothetical protein
MQALKHESASTPLFGIVPFTPKKFAYSLCPFTEIAPQFKVPEEFKP